MLITDTGRHVQVLRELLFQAEAATASRAMPATAEWFINAQPASGSVVQGPSHWHTESYDPNDAAEQVFDLVAATA